jgi:hypothetical protein
MAEITREVYTRKLAGEAREPRLLGMWAPQPCAFVLGLRAAASGQRSTARDRPATSEASRPRPRCCVVRVTGCPRKSLFASGG